MMTGSYTQILDRAREAEPPADGILSRTVFQDDRIKAVVFRFVGGKVEMEVQLRLRIVLESPPAGVDFGLQQGKGTDYQTVQTQRSQGDDLRFEGTVTAKDNRDDGLPNFLGPLTQGPPGGRFLYIDIGKSAGQADSGWDRRLKVPLGGITWETIEQVAADPDLVLEARLPGTGRDGGPSCATVLPLMGWVPSRRTR
jgi:Family of unknown function (DUF5990)